MTGSVITSDGDRCYNRLHWATPDGEVVHYDKRHLFRMSGEHERYTAGTHGPHRRVARLSRRAHSSVTTCASRSSAGARRTLDYDVLVYVANWPEVRADAWSTLLKARAMENQAYVGRREPHRRRMATARRTPGQSAAVDFLGRPLVEAGQRAGGADRASSISRPAARIP